MEDVRPARERGAVAIFVDAENAAHWLRAAEVERLVAVAERYGDPVVRRAYARWTNTGLAHLQAPFSRYGFELVHTWHPVSGKNSADIQMVVDVMDYAAREPRLQCFVLATGDADFSPLFRRLRERGREIVGVGPRSPLSDVVSSLCVAYVQVEVEGAPASPSPGRRGGAGPNAPRPGRAGGLSEAESGVPVPSVAPATAVPAAPAPDREVAFELFRKVLADLGGSATLTTIKDRMLEDDRSFGRVQRALGFRTFTRFAEQSGAVVWNVGHIRHARLRDGSDGPVAEPRPTAPPRAARSAPRPAASPTPRRAPPTGSTPAPAAPGPGARDATALPAETSRPPWADVTPGQVERAVQVLGQPVVPRTRADWVARLRKALPAPDKGEAARLFDALLRAGSLRPESGRGPRSPTRWALDVAGSDPAAVLDGLDAAILAGALRPVEGDPAPAEPASLLPLLVGPATEERLASLLAHVSQAQGPGGWEEPWAE